MQIKLTTLLLLSAFGFHAPIQAQTPRFIPGPDPTKTWNIGEYGPTGLELSLEPPSFTMKVTRVIAGSPAALSGQISVNQIIESINGVVLDTATDPRFTLGDIITEAEATDGVLALQIRDVGVVTVNIPVLGAYSASWPLNCPKSDHIVNNLAARIASQSQPNMGSITFLLSTGDDSYLPVIGNWIANMNSIGTYPWHSGMKGIGICEYYLRTGDARAIPLIQEGADQLRDLMYVGGWSGRGHASITYSTGSGHLNAAGVPALTFLMLAKLCGVNVDDHTLQESLKNFYRYAGHDNVGYGNNWPEGGFRDNGKTSALAFAMQGAVRLDPAGESSIYAKARDISAVKAFYANPWFNRAHPGGGYGEMWHAMAMGLMADTRPAQYRDYMDARRWHFELSRYHNGGIGISDGGGSHDFDSPTGTEWDWGTFYALAYTMPRKELILFGAPLTEHCVPYDLPDLPWGTAADEAFLSLTPATQSGGAVTDLSDERLGTHDSVGYNAKMQAAGVTDDDLMEYAHHIDHGIRSDAAKYIVAQGRNNLLLPLLQSDDPRVRHTGLLTITGMFKGSSFALGSISPAAIQEVEGILEDANESLWVRMHAAQALARFGATAIGAHKATLLAMLGHEDWWVGDSAGRALREIIALNDHYQDVIPPMAKFSCEIPVVNLLWGYAYTESSMMKKLASAPITIRDFAADYFVLEHADNPVIMQGPGGHVVTQGATYINNYLGLGADKLLGAEPMPRVMALSTVTYRKTLNEADQFNYDGYFTYDPGMATTWKHVTKLSNPDSLGDVIDAGPPASSSPDITFADGGFIEGQAGAVWTQGYYIDLFRREAREALKRQHNGKYYLLIERGIFDAKDNPDADWHPGYDAYVRKLEDTAPPTPDPMTFALAPTGTGPMNVGMVAATAIDGSEPVEYYFENTTNSDFRDWSTDPAWSNTGLGAGTYGYRVKARDGEGNETAWSDVVNGAPGDDTTAPFPNPTTFARPPTAKSLDSITMTANSARDFNGVEYYFACTGGGGPDSGWQDSPAFTPTGLTRGVSYTYVVRARDKSTARNTTADSDPASAAPAAVTDITPPLIALLDPVNYATGIATNASLVLTFDEEIAAGTGSITIKNLTDGTETGMAITDAQVAISGTTVTINPSGGFIEGRTYAIRITEGAIVDLAANAFPGITNDTIWKFTTAPAATVVLSLTTNNPAPITLSIGYNYLSYSSLPVDYLIVAGGGGGGSTANNTGRRGGGGGAGGLLQGTGTPISGIQTITVGAGGTGGVQGITSGDSQLTRGATGGNSSISGIDGATALGGGGGASSTATTSNASSGGSGGGGYSSTTQAGAAGTSGQGNSGGSGINNSNGFGGGAGAAGGTGTGGTGLSSLITGSAVTYAAGGRYGGSVAATPAPAAANTGNGGNGISPNQIGAGTTRRNGQAGGSGLVVVSYSGPQVLTGGTVSTYGGNTVHQFLNTGASTLGFNATIAGDIDGDGNLIWDGGGTLTLSGSNGYTGTTAITNGTLKMGANNVLPDSTDILIGTATLDADTFDDTVDTLDVTGTAVINLGTGANLVFAGGGTATWDGTLNITGAFVSGSSLNFGSSSGLTSAQLAAITINGVTGFYTLDGRGFLTSGGGSPFDTWATRGGAIGVTFDGDANEDGVPDGLAFLLGADTPSTDATGLLPTVDETGGDLVMNFTCLAAAARGASVLTLEYGGDLIDPWLSVPVPGAVGAPNPIDVTTATGSVSFVATDGGPNGQGDALIDIVATISDATESAAGKLFGRLEASE